MNGNLQQSGRRQSVGARTVESAPWHVRIMTALASASTADMGQLNTLLRTGLGLVFLFEVVTWLAVARFDPELLHTEQPFFLFDIALVGAALGLTYFRWFGRNWSPVTMAFCLMLIASRTLSTLAIDQDEPLLLALFVLVLGTAVLVPWSVRWQGVLTLAGLIAFAIAAMNGAVKPADLHRWLVLAAIGAFALSFTALKSHHRSQTILIDALLDKEKRLAKSEAMLRTLFDAVPDIVTLTRFSDGKLLEINEEFLKRTGLGREQALATTVLQLGAWVHPEDRAG